MPIQLTASNPDINIYQVVTFPKFIRILLPSFKRLRSSKRITPLNELLAAVLCTCVVLQFGIRDHSLYSRLSLNPHF